MWQAGEEGSEYWERRRKNNEAARKSREKRRLSDAAMEERLLELRRQNEALQMELTKVLSQPPVPGPVPVPGQSHPCPHEHGLAVCNRCDAATRMTPLKPRARLQPAALTQPQAAPVPTQVASYLLANSHPTQSVPFISNLEFVRGTKGGIWPRLQLERRPGDGGSVIRAGPGLSLPLLLPPLPPIHTELALPGMPPYLLPPAHLGLLPPPHLLQPNPAFPKPALPHSVHSLISGGSDKGPSAFQPPPPKRPTTAHSSPDSTLAPAPVPPPPDCKVQLRARLMGNFQL